MIQLYIYIHVFILFQTSFSFRLLQNIEQSSLCCTVGSCSFSILNITMCTCQFHSLSLSLPHHPFPLVTVSLFSKSVSLFLFVSKFRCPSTEEWTWKTWYTHTMNIDEILLSHKNNEIMSFAAAWMDLGIFILNEVREREISYDMAYVLC